MAQKQFKIGLSNQDKQNMAQDVYERVLALTFNEYDTTTEYEVGDFVVYNDQLYKCIGATSGAWDSSKWQLATLNDLVDDIENAVAFVNDKANVDGNYPTMTVGAADNLTPYDEDSGVNQEQPFLLQGTGCGNGEQQVDTGALGLLKEKQGNTVVVNQKVQTMDITSGTIDASDYRDLAFPSISGFHKVLLIISSKITSANANKGVYRLIGVNAENQYTERASAYAEGKVFIVGEMKNYPGYTGLIVRLVNTDSENSLVFQDADAKLVDLTQWFNGDVPQDLLDHPDHFFRYYQGSLDYNEGTLVNANGRYLKTIGRNQWDEEWEEGSIDQAGDVIAGSAIHSKNLIKVIPNTDYYFKVGTGGYLIIDWFDKDGNNVGYLFGYGRNDHYQAPANAVSMKFAVVSGYGATYNNDITISIYYDGESGYDQYYPYEELANIDTGTEVLRSAGGVVDSKTPDGTITRRVDYVDLGTLTWTYNSSNGFYTSSSLQGIIKGATRDSVDVANLTCNTATPTYVDDVFLGNYGIGVQNDGTIYFKNSNTSPTTQPTGILFYELAEPTTEQGTSYSENLVIDDFGSMDFGGTNGVPQGALIFYPVDYKAFVDTLYKYTDGISSDIALKSDLPTAPQTWAESLPGYDATKTQVLKNIEGTLTWVTEE